MSKFFALFEPHVLLLDGAMKYLPRDSFEVICIPIPRSDVKPLAPSLVDGCDVIVEISYDFDHTIEKLNLLNLDILVFADTLSEPMNHFLAHSRLAKIQV